jgi:peptidoglycan/xylan/chitin deacetylase (PgdA/CDA1 family)
MMRSLFRQLSPAGPGARLSIFIFHRVLRASDPLQTDVPDAPAFETMCRWLAAWFNVLPLDRAAVLLAQDALPERAAAITFDDGYQDNCTVAMPILQRHGLTATFFVATDYLDGGCMWNDVVAESVRQCAAPVLDLSGLATGGAPLGRYAVADWAQKRLAAQQITGAVKYLGDEARRQAVAEIARVAGARAPTDLMMSSAQVRQLEQAGMQVGAHTATHPILAKLHRAAAKADIARSKRVLEDILQREVSMFAYPNGKPGTDYLPETVQVVRECGFKTAVTTAWGAAGQGADPLQLPRFTPWDTTRLRFGVRVARNLFNARRAADAHA